MFKGLKKTMHYGCLVVVALFLLGINTAYSEICGVQAIELIAGGGGGSGIIAGTVTVANDENNLIVTLTAEPGWFLGETHVHTAQIVGGDIPGALSNFPLTRSGLPKPGKFESFVNGQAVESTITHPPISIIDDNGNVFEQVVIAVHAELIKKENGEVVQVETSWASGTEFNPEKNWSMYFVYNVTPCVTSQCPCWPPGLRGTLLGIPDVTPNFPTDSPICFVLDGFIKQGIAVTEAGRFELKMGAHGCFGFGIAACSVSPDFQEPFCMTAEETNICLNEMKQFCSAAP